MTYLMKDACAGVGFNGDTHHLMHRGQYARTYTTAAEAKLALRHVAALGCETADEVREALRAWEEQRNG